MSQSRMGMIGVVPASLLGIASPLCMYGTIPLAASFSKSGMRDEWLASFMMCSILLNPQLIVYSTALGPTALAVRIISCFLCGILAGVLIRLLGKDRPFFNFSGFEEQKSRDTHPNPIIRLVQNIGRNVKVTGPSTKITNLGALKIVLGLKHFLFYLVFVMAFSFATGLAVNGLV